MNENQIDGAAVPAPEGKIKSLTPCQTGCGDCAGCPASAAASLPTVSLSSDTKAALKDHLETRLHLGRPETVKDWLAHSEGAADALASAKPALSDLAARLKAPGGPPAAVITNLPVDTIHEVTDPTPLATLVALGLTKLFGQPFQYRQQNGGELTAALRAKPAFAGRSNTGESNLTFEDHTDDRIWAPDFSCEWIGLLGIRNDAKVATTYTPIEPVIPHLAAASLRILCEPRFMSKAPTSFGFRMQVWTPPVPVLWRSPSEEWQVGLPTYNCRPADPADQEAQRALDELKQLLAQRRFRLPVVVDRGVCLIFANNRGLHGRAGYEGERLVLRTYIRRDLKALTAKTGEPGPIFDAWELLR